MTVIEKKRAIPQSTSVSATTPESLVSDDEKMRWISSTEMEWKKHVFARMDEDEKLWTQDPYTLRDAKGEILDDVISVTMNDARVFGERVLAVLNESEEVIEINGQKNGKEMTGHETNIIENWWYDIMYLVNENLNNILMPDLDPYLWEQISVRGRVGARILLSEDREGFKIDLLPPDMRKCVFSVGRSGLSKVAFWDTLDKDWCKEEYPDYKPVTDSITRWDYWDASEEVVFLDGTYYNSTPNKLGHPPFIIQICQQGTFLDTSSRALRMRGDSIYSAKGNFIPS